MLRRTVTKAGFLALRCGFTPPSSSMARRLAEHAALRDVLAHLDVNVVIDVGANKGWFSEHLRLVGYTGHILSFEPIEGDAREIRAKAVGDPTWRTVEAALGDHDGHALFNVISLDGLTVFSSFLDSTEFAPTAQVEVPVSRLDTIAADLLDGIPDPRIFLKMDTQGFDLRVWAGAEGIRPLIVGLQSELSVEPIYEGMPSYLEALQTYGDAGYDLMSLSIVNRTAHGSVLEYDCVMCRRGEIRTSPTMDDGVTTLPRA